MTKEDVKSEAFNRMAQDLKESFYNSWWSVAAGILDDTKIEEPIKRLKRRRDSAVKESLTIEPPSSIKD